MGARKRGTTEHGCVSPRPRASFTLIELLVVLGVISIILSIGVGAYVGLIRTTALRGEIEAVIALIRSARAAAIAEGGETFIRLDTETGRLYPFSRTKVGVWHFETLDGTKSLGAFGHAAVVTGDGATLTDGKVGKALHFDGTYYLKCKMTRASEWIEIPTYDARDGVAIEAWLMPVEAEADRRAVLSRDGWFEMALDYDDTNKRLALAAAATTLDRDASAYLRHTASTAPVIRPNEWTHVSMTCHRFSSGITLRINGVEQDLESSASEATAAPGSNAETAIGAAADGTDPFHGRIDELIFSAYAADTVHKITSKLTLEAEGLAQGDTIRFDAGGKLTPAHDGVSPKVIIKDYAGQKVKARAVITVGSMGAVDVNTTHN